MCKSANVCPNHHVQISSIKKAMTATTMTTTSSKHNNNNNNNNNITKMLANTNI